MKKRMIPSISGAILAALMLFSSAMPATVFAGENIPVTTDITVTYIVKGNAERAGGDIFTLTPDDPCSPMPEGSVGCEKKMSISGEGNYSFGEIRYERPDVYWYTITRDVTEKKGVTKDRSVYRAKVIALNDGHGYVLVYLEGSDEKRELIYTDRVAPETGDDKAIMIYAAMAAAAGAVLAVFAAARNSRKRKVTDNEQ